ncbi:MAG: serine/threonine protein kinase [Rhizobiales bacterium]|nr:serine/threonine protein kinase [Hyphomicrobiales bacterium]
MGEVYRGHSIQTGDAVAIKVIKADFAENESALELFRKEARALHNLQHEAIVRYFVFAVDRDLQRPYLAMEYVEGLSLSDMARAGPMPIDQALALRQRIALGLHAAHERGIIHRDVSPDNIIMPQNDVRQAKIIDFGIARSTALGAGTIIGGGVAGKYSYMSPEQANGGEVGAKSDIYSFGLVLAEALRGKPIDMGGSLGDVIRKRMTVPDLSDIDARIRPLLESMLQPEPANRPDSMRAVADWAPGGRAEKATAAPPPPQVVAARRRTGLYAILGGLLVLAGGAAVYVAATMWAWTTPPKPPAPEPPSLAPPSLSPAPPALTPPEAPPGKTEPATPPAGGVDANAGMSGGMAGGMGAGGMGAGGMGAGMGAGMGSGVGGMASGGMASGGMASGGMAGGGMAGMGEPVAPPPAPPGGQQTASTAGDGPLFKAPTTDLAPVTQPERIEQMGKYLRDFQGGDCFIARPLALSAQAAEVEGIATDAAPLEKLNDGFRQQFGFEPSIGAWLIAPGQCAVTTFLAKARIDPAIAPRVELGATQLRSGQYLTGLVEAPKERTVEVLQISDDGEAQNITALLRNAGPRSFNLRVERASAGSGAKPQLIVAIASPQPLAALRTARPVAAERLLAAALAEIATRGYAVGVTVRAYNLD